MGTLYTTKLLRRFAYGMTRPAFWTSAVGICLLGILFGWIIFAEPHKINVVLDTGNVAEWVAAMATIAVGYQASVIAMNGHAYRMREDEKAERRERDERGALFVRILLRLKRLTRAQRSLTSLANRANTPSQTTFHFVISRGVSRLNTLLVWSEAELACIKTDQVEAFDGFQSAVEKYRDKCEVYLIGVNPDSDDPAHDVDVSLFKDSIEELNSLVRLMEDLCKKLQAGWERDHPTPTPLK